ncbi:MAG: tetratricopeptide repeat protein [Chitinophagaceae bacterium]|nr:tetratricopeptide repeat protein [Bacteroidota bacterium]MCC6257972.1 tetratricopeptide repeat protein [Chitinophagaceae bacterium]
MRLLVFALLSFLAGTVSVCAQSSTEDSLNQLLREEKNTEKKLQIIARLTDDAFQSDFERAKRYAIQGVNLSFHAQNMQWLPKFQERLGRMYANLLNLDSASFYFDQALAGYSAAKDLEGQATTYFKIGWVYKRKGNIKQAMDVDLKALKLMEQISNNEGIAEANNRISEDLYRQERFDEALDYAERNIAFSKKHNFFEPLAIALKSAGDANVALGNPAEAYKRYDSALTILKENNASIFTILNIKNDRANALKRMGRYKEALAEYTECLKIGEEVNYENQVYVSYANLGETYMLLGNYREALQYQLKTVAMQEKNHDVSNLTENYGHVSSIYEKLGDFKHALFYQKKARQMRDSTAKEESDKVMSEMLAQFESEKKDKTISFQKSTIAQQKRAETLYIILAGLLAFILFGLIYSYHKRQRKNRQLTLLNQKLDIRNKQNELLLKEIHHRVKNNLELVKSLLALQSAGLSDPASREAMQSSESRVQSMGIIHQKLYQGTNPGSIEMKDYFINLGEGILDSFNAAGRVQIDCDMEKLELDVDSAIPIGLIVNELITNSLKYAFPGGEQGNIFINLIRTSQEMLTLKVADTGVGKEEGSAPQGTGFGRQLISLLTRQMNGQMKEYNKNGTVVEFEFHIKTAA